MHFNFLFELNVEIKNEVDMSVPLTLLSSPKILDSISLFYFGLPV